jgi:hypothetical protein
MKGMALALVLLGAGGVARGQAPDPFEGVKEAEPAGATRSSWWSRMVGENFGFRGEAMSQFDVSGDGDGASRQSVGVEVLKKFSTATRTVAAFNFQGRLVRRDGYNPVSNDREGGDAAGVDV